VSPSATEPRARIVPRAGLGAAGTRLTEQPASIAYFGASVTAQKQGYRPLLQERLRRRFGLEHESVFAGIGGVDVISAVFLADEFVVQRRPDLCLIEFTSTVPIRDSTLADAERAMEGMIGKLVAAGIQPCLLHLGRREWRTEHAEQLAAFERVAGRHQVPSIDLTPAFTESDDPGRLFRDPVHTSAPGSELVAQLTDDALASIATARPDEPEDRVPAAPSGKRFHGAHVVPVTSRDSSPAGEMGLFRLHRPFLELPLGSSIRRRFDERLAGLVMLVGPESGELEIVDPDGVQRLMAWDQYCHYERFTVCLFERPCAVGAEVAIRLTETIPDYSQCRRPVDPPDRRTARMLGYAVLPE
jgi:hypothetical protein